MAGWLSNQSEEQVWSVNEFVFWITRQTGKGAINWKRCAAFKMAPLLKFACNRKVLIPSPFLVSEIYTTMLAGLVMDVNLLRIARLFKGSCIKFWYMIHGTKYSTKYGTIYGTRYNIRYKV